MTLQSVVFLVIWARRSSSSSAAAWRVDTVAMLVLLALALQRHLDLLDKAMAGFGSSAGDHRRRGLRDLGRAQRHPA
ncbi:MAG: hypothetical protein U1F18_06120 [Steroidobacteraceae bacterium]